MTDCPPEIPACAADAAGVDINVSTVGVDDATGPMPREIGRLRQVLRGRAVPFTRPGSLSGIGKAPVEDAVRVSATGLDGDEQGDLRVHGGSNKAVHRARWSRG